MDQYIERLVFCLIFCLIFFPETSLNTALSINKESLYSVYLYKVMGVLTISDLIILFLAFIVLIRTILRGSIGFGVATPIFCIYLFYYFLGGIFNIFVAMELKAFLYDIKAGLYLFIPFMVLKDSSLRITETLIIKVAIIFTFGILMDAIIINYSGGGHYPSNLNLIPILEIFPLSLLVGMLFLFSNRKLKVLSGFAFFFEVFSSINRVNLGALLNGVISFTWVILIKLKFSFKLMVGSMIALYYFIVVGLMNLIMYVQNPLMKYKEDGWLIRKIEIQNFFENSLMNFPIIIGKGLGTTWKEVFFSPISNVYSQGSFLYSENNFIFHNTLGGTFYKFGIVGSLLIITYLAILSTRVLFLTKNTKNDSIGAFLSFSIPAFVMININGIGLLKGALISSLILFSINQLLKDKPLY